MSTQGPASTVSTNVPGYLSQYAQGILSGGAQQAQQPYQPYTQQRVADLSPLQQGALNGYGQLGQAALPYAGQAASTLSGFMNGDSNPYQQQVIDRMTRGVTDQYNNAVSQTTGRFNSPGNFGSVRQGMADEMNQRALATGLGDATGQVLSSGYENAANRALQSVGALGGLANTGVSALGSALTAGAVPQQQQQQLLSSLYGDFQEQRQYPWTQLQNAAGLLTGARGATGQTQTSVQGYDPVSQGVGLAQLASQKGGAGGSSGSKGGSQGLPSGLDSGGGPAYG
jgi:hypothetical protein